MWAGACEEMTRHSDVHSPGDRLIHLLTEEYPGLALMLQSRPKDVATLGTRLVCISNLPEDESAVRAPSIVGHPAIWFRAGPWYRNGKVNAFECHAGTG